MKRAPSLTLLDVSAALLGEGLSVRFRAPGHSMSPTIRDGEVVEVEPCSGGALRRDDIAFYEGPRGPIAHRVVAVERTSAGALIHLQGDAACGRDEPIVQDAVLGRVVAVERGNRRIRLGGPFASLCRHARGAVSVITMIDGNGALSGHA